MRFVIPSALCLLFSAPLCLAQEKEAADAAMAMPKPGPEHGHLKTAEGTWDATIEMAGQPAVKGTSVMKVGMNGFWLVDHFTCDWNGMPFEGHGGTGYDPIKKKYVSTWIDNASPSLTVTEGTFNPQTKTLSMTGDGYNDKGEKVKVRTETIHKDANSVVFEMFQKGADGKEAKVMTITYVRSKQAGDKKPAGRK
jgi:hypothetical protein